MEITYGLDRIALALQGVDSVWEMAYGTGISYENVLLQSEIEHCQYYFNVADVDSIRQIYDIYEQEAKRCIEANSGDPGARLQPEMLPFIQHFRHTRRNWRDRAGQLLPPDAGIWHGRCRILYVAQREQLEYPLLNGDAEAAVPIRRLQQVHFAQSETSQTLLLEIGSEELPVSDLDSALNQLKTAVPGLL